MQVVGYIPHKTMQNAVVGNWADEGETVHMIFDQPVGDDAADWVAVYADTDEAPYVYGWAPSEWRGEAYDPGWGGKS